MESIRYFKVKAKHLLKSHNSGEAAAKKRINSVLKQTDNITLQRIQHVVAVESGFANWGALKDASTIEQNLAIVMDKEPLLHNFGIGLSSEHWSKPKEERREILAKEREELRNNLSDVAWIVEWLKNNITPIKTINRRHSSYGLKHIAEKSSPRKYLSNGAFIAAAMIAGYPHKMDSPNPLFGMSERSIKRARDKR